MSRPLRAIVIAEISLPHQGGSERVVHTTALRLVHHGWNVTVYTPAMAGDRAFDDAQPYHVIRSRAWARIRAWEHRGGMWSRFARLLGIPLIFFALALRRWDAAVAVHIIPVALPFTFLRCIGRGPLISWALGEEIQMGMKSRAMRWQITRSLRAAHLIASISRDTSNAVEALGIPSGKVFLQHPTPDLLFFRPLRRDRAALRSRLGIEAGGLLLFSVSRLVERKGFDTALLALGALKREAKLPQIKYWIAGEGAYRVRLEEIVREQELGDFVRFVGSCTEEEKRDYLEAADLFLMPNRRLASGEQEGFGIVFQEAAMRGTPVVGGRSGGAPDAVGEGISGWLVNPDSPAELTALLREILNDAPRLAAMRKEVRRWSVKHFLPHARMNELNARLRG